MTSIIHLPPSPYFITLRHCQDKLHFFRWGVGTAIQSHGIGDLSDSFGRGEALGLGEGFDGFSGRGAGA